MHEIGGTHRVILEDLVVPFTPNYPNNSRDDTVPGGGDSRGDPSPTPRSGEKSEGVRWPRQMEED